MPVKQMLDVRCWMLVKKRKKQVSKKMATTREVQAALNRYPSALPPLVVDGIAGSKTSARVREWQYDHGFPVNGIISNQMLEALGLSTGVGGAASASSGISTAAAAVGIAAAAAAAATAAQQAIRGYGNANVGDIAVAGGMAAAHDGWVRSTGSGVGFTENIGTILKQAGEYLSYADPTVAGKKAGEALKEAGVTKEKLALGLFAGLSIGTLALVGGGVLLLMLLAKR